MLRCPRCKGEGRLEGGHEPQCVMGHNDYCECVEERWYMCPICKGHGKISRVVLATYQAQGVWWAT